MVSIKIKGCILHQFYGKKLKSMPPLNICGFTQDQILLKLFFAFNYGLNWVAYQDIFTQVNCMSQLRRQAKDKHFITVKNSEMCGHSAIVFPVLHLLLIWGGGMFWPAKIWKTSRLQYSAFSESLCCYLSVMVFLQFRHVAPGFPKDYLDCLSIPTFC